MEKDNQILYNLLSDMHEVLSYSPDSSEKHIKTSREVVSKIVPEISDPCHSLFSQLRENIVQGQYGVIMEEGKTARIPTFVIGRAIGDIYKMNGHQYPSFITDELYISLGNQEQSPVTQEVFEIVSMRPEGKKVLLITEYISSGNTIEKYRELERLGIEFDVATLFSKRPKASYLGKIKDLNNLYIGQEEHADPLLSRRPELIGRKSHLFNDSIFKYRKVKDETRPFDYPFNDVKASEVMQGVWPQARQLRADLVEAYK